MATVIGYFQSGPTHDGPNTKSVEVEDDETAGTSVDGQVQEFYELGAAYVEVDGELVEQVEPVAVEEAPLEAGPTVDETYLEEEVEPEPNPVPPFDPNPEG